MVSNFVLIVSAEARVAVEREPEDTPFEQRIEAAMRSANNAWVTSNEEDRFKGAIGGLLLASNVTTEEKERIKSEMEGIKTLSAMMAGVPVDFERVKVPENTIGLLAMWRAIRDA